MWKFKPVTNLIGDDTQQIRVPILVNIGVRDIGLREMEGTDAIINLSRMPCYDIL